MGDVEKAKRAGTKYAEDQIEGDYFQHWIREQMYEATQLRPEEIASGLENETVAKDKRAAERLARILLQQLRWDTERDLDDRVIDDLLHEAGVSDPRSKAPALGPMFWGAMRDKLESPAVRSWLAEEIIMPIAKELTRGRRRRR